MRLGHFLHIACFVGFLCTGVFLNAAFGDTSTISETENRALAPLPVWSGPALWSGAYLRGVENYMADHIAFRETLVRASKTLASWRGFNGGDDAIIVASKANNDADTVNEPAAERGRGQKPLVEHEKPAEIPKSAVAQRKLQQQDEAGRVIGKVLIIGNRAMFLYSYAPAAGKAYADMINSFQGELARRLGEQIRVSVLLAPSAVEFVQSDKLRSLSSSQEEAIEAVYGQIDARVTKVNVVPYLRQHDGEYLFFRTDHHWTATGAYYAYQAFANARGMQPFPLSGYNADKVGGFLGSLYASTLNKTLEATPDTIVFYKPFVEHEYVVHYSGPLKMKLLDLYHADKKTNTGSF